MKTDTDNAPALTAEEWGRLEFYREGVVAVEVRDDEAGKEVLQVVEPSSYEPAWLGAVDRYALAALCLHDQPFGFTWADVDFLRYHAKERRDENGPHEAAGIEFDELADRIAALLPPREPAE